MSRRARLVTLAAVGAVLAVGGIAEAVARHYAADRFADRMERRLHTGLDVGFGPTPVTLQLARGSFPRVEVSGEGATFRRFSGVDLHAELDDVVRTGDGLSVRDSRVSAELGDAALTDAVSAMTGGALGRATVTTDPAAHELVVHAGPAGRVTVGFRPVLEDGGLRFERTAVRIGDRAVPDALAGQLLGDAPREVDLSALPLRLEPERVAVTPDGLRLELTGGPTTVKA
ncbi:LmeA family phospholipid-binding protein [Streptomyces sp. NPDC001595]|uniref:LmeA family phospholipid-binding protein n=1 Tax=Streptomyces sp. NPDC001532 TaxID=3154520 RepID=UPI00331BCFB4